MKKRIALAVLLASLAANRADAATATEEAWADFGFGLAAVAVNSVYIPAKIAYAAVGGLVGAVALGVTGGNMDAADGIWGPALGGDYVVTANMIKGDRPLHFIGARPSPAPADDF
ncbi:MAG TPA: hypothetical protein VEB21_21260 [Terriglobales bacterium]|nr:hypothetical protein [Terriglobales bacterium]